jgi:hypothetical protein
MQRSISTPPVRRLKGQQKKNRKGKHSRGPALNAVRAIIKPPIKASCVLRPAGIVCQVDILVISTGIAGVWRSAHAPVESRSWAGKSCDSELNNERLHCCRLNVVQRVMVLRLGLL